jgi:hypothetical protein
VKLSVIVVTKNGAQRVVPLDRGDGHANPAQGNSVSEQTRS